MESSSTIVQTLSSRYAVVLGGYGPGYTELSQVEVVKHDGVCNGSISDIPPAMARFLGDVSGLAEFVGEQIMFCRHSSCWRLNLRKNTWTRAASLQVRIVTFLGEDRKMLKNHFLIKQTPSLIIFGTPCRACHKSKIF